MVRLRSGSKDIMTAKELLVVPVTSKELSATRRAKQSSDLDAIERKSGVRYKKLLQGEGFQGAEGSTSYVRLVGELACKAVLFVGWNETDPEEEAYRKLGALVAKAARCHRLHTLTFFEDGFELGKKNAVKALLEGVILSGYTFDKYRKKSKSKVITVKAVEILTKKKLPSTLQKEAEIYSQSTILSRDLVNMPASDCTPSYMVRSARKVARDGKLKIQVFDKAKLTKMKAGGILGVSRGGSDAPALIKLTYKPRGKVKKVISLIGKGVTFDTGGLSIKTGKHMNDMKCDMAGAAAVMGAMMGVAQLKPQVEVRGYMPVVENMVSDKSFKLGDVLNMLSGKTVEILNTDAEGRLILADALTMAEKDGCDQMIDLATLTGACLVALGQDYAGVFSADNDFADKIIAAGEKAGESIWQLPLVEDYRSQLSSSVADIKNIGGGYGGSITAALFLSEFVEKTTWAHLDIAGPAFMPSATDYAPIGATGFGVRTLLRYITSL